MYKEIDIYKLKELLKNNNLNLIDIRDNYSYLNGTIKNAKNIPYNELLINPNKYLNKNKTYYIFCQFGSSSKRLCSRLTNLGYDVVTILGGYSSYIKDSKL